MNNEVALISYSEIRQMAVDIHKAGMFGLKTPESAMALMLLAQAENLHPMTALRQFHILSDGRVTMRSDAMLGKLQARGVDVEWLNKADDRIAQVGRWTHKGRTIEIGFTMAEAIRAGYTYATPKAGSGWQRDPAAMLRARTISRAARMLDPGVVAGLYTPEEMEDIPLETAKAPRGTKAAPDVQTDTVVSSTPGADSQAAAEPAQAQTQATAPAAPATTTEDPAMPKDEAGRFRYIRGQFNQDLLASKDRKSFSVARGKLNKAHGKEFEKNLTGVRPGETFESLLTEHWQRIEGIEKAAAHAQHNAEWRSKLGTTFDVPQFRALEKQFLDGEVDQDVENSGAIDRKGKALKLPEYIGGEASDSAKAAAEQPPENGAPLAMDEDFNAEMEGGK